MEGCLGGGELGFGDRDDERGGGGDRPRSVSGAVSWYGAKSMACGSALLRDLSRPALEVV